ncbi:hypothetical protein QPK87_12490 [Kamptonema cortianum]|nr:hypothetical protein [Kamptonema cortianum]
MKNVFLRSTFLLAFRHLDIQGASAFAPAAPILWHCSPIRMTHSHNPASHSGSSIISAAAFRRSAGGDQWEACPFSPLSCLIPGAMPGGVFEKEQRLA